MIIQIMQNAFPVMLDVLRQTSAGQLTRVCPGRIHPDGL